MRHRFHFSASSSLVVVFLAFACRMAAAVTSSCMTSTPGVEYHDTWPPNDAGFLLDTVTMAGCPGNGSGNFLSVFFVVVVWFLVFLKQKKIYNSRLFFRGCDAVHAVDHPVAIHHHLRARRFGAFDSCQRLWVGLDQTRRLHELSAASDKDDFCRPGQFHRAADHQCNIDDRFHRIFGQSVGFLRSFFSPRFQISNGWVEQTSTTQRCSSVCS